MGITVSIQICGNIDEVWQKTQDPELHERWDLRFTRIAYLPKAHQADPQRFLYETRLGFGIKVSGEGESIAVREADNGVRTSSLRFWSEQSHSLIREGSGYWQYTPLDTATEFKTGYDYTTRFGPLGKTLDRFAFRRLIAWATAWGFDSLRLWIEKGVTPEASRRAALTHAFARTAIAFVWIWHGLVPKLIFHAPEESLPLTRLAFGPLMANNLVTATGVIEIILGLLTLFLWRYPKLLLLEGLAFLGLGIGAMIVAPETLRDAFSPMSLTACLVALAAIGYVNGRDLPSATHCDYHWSTKK
jgi:hypothetical protein